MALLTIDIKKVLIILLFIASNLRDIKSVDIPDLSEIFYREMDDDIYGTLNNLFKSLKLSKNFTQSYKTNLLLKLHEHFKSLAKYNYIFLSNIENIITNDNVKANGTNNAIEETIMKNNTYNNYDNTDLNGHEFMNFTTVEFSNDTVELSKECIDDFIYFMNKLSLDDLLEKPVNDTKANQKHKIASFRRKNLKVWRPTETGDKLGTGNETRRIYKGLTTKIKKYAFMASIHIRNDFVCAGSIISADLVISAASCLQRFYKTKYRRFTQSVTVRVGSEFTDRDGTVLDVVEAHFHPFYNPENLENNLVIIRTDLHFHFNTRRLMVRRTKIDRNARSMPSNIDSIIVLGWGAKDRRHSNDVHSLSRAKLDTYNLKECMNVYTKHYVTRKNFCAGFVSRGGGACNRDSGGPGLLGDVLYGVISFGAPACGTPDAPTVFTKLGFYVKWIDSIINSAPALSSTQESITESQLRTGTDNLNKEIKILRNILNQLAQTNDTIDDEDIKQIFEEEIKEDRNETYESTTTMNPLGNPLLNQSVFLLPDIHNLPEYYDDDEDRVVLTSTKSTNLWAEDPTDETTDPKLEENFFKQFLNHLTASPTTTKTKATTTKTTKDPYVADYTDAIWAKPTIDDDFLTISFPTTTDSIGNYVLEEDIKANSTTKKTGRQRTTMSFESIEDVLSDVLSDNYEIFGNITSSEYNSKEGLNIESDGRLISTRLYYDSSSHKTTTVNNKLDKGSDKKSLKFGKIDINNREKNSAITSHNDYYENYEMTY